VMVISFAAFATEAQSAVRAAGFVGFNRTAGRATGCRWYPPNATFFLACLAARTGRGSVRRNLAPKAPPAIPDSFVCLEHDGKRHHTEGREQKIEQASYV
jgi:hypothetical protein